MAKRDVPLFSGVPHLSFDLQDENYGVVVIPRKHLLGNIVINRLLELECSDQVMELDKFLMNIPRENKS